jgi:hypothetical protein
MGIKLRVLHMLDKHSTTELYPQSLSGILKDGGSLSLEKGKNSIKRGKQMSKSTEM